MASVSRVFRVAFVELSAAVRNRRAVVTTLLFAAVAVAAMYGTISAFAAMEQEVLRGLGLPPSENPGAVTMTLWKSKPFTRIISNLAGNSLVFADIAGRHPIVLAYALFIFHIVPLLTLIVSAPRVASDLRSGAARYWLVRVTRTEWSFGLFFGEALMIAVAMLVGAAAAWGTAAWRLGGADLLLVGSGLLDWSARAWVYAFAWLGLFMGLSHIAKSGGKATALAVLGMMGAAAWTPMLRNVSEWLAWAPHLDILVPQSSIGLLWRRSLPAFLLGVVQLSALAFTYLLAGVAVFRRRDV